MSLTNLLSIIQVISNRPSIAMGLVIFLISCIVVFVTLGKKISKCARLESFDSLTSEIPSEEPELINPTGKIMMIEILMNIVNDRVFL